MDLDGLGDTRLRIIDVDDFGHKSVWLPIDAAPTPRPAKNA
jgi:hypothetical protein